MLFFFLFLSIVAIFNVEVFATNLSDITIPYIYISISYGQAMGLMFCRDTYYIGYNGNIQKVKEDCGISDTIQAVEESQMDDNSARDIFAILQKEITTFLNKEKINNSYLNNIRKIPKEHLQELQEYVPPTARIELLKKNKNFYFLEIDRTDMKGQIFLKKLIDIFNKKVQKIKFKKNSQANFFIRSHQIREQNIIEQYKKDHLIKNIDIADLRKSKAVFLSIIQERKLIALNEHKNPFYPLKFFLWPYKWPYSVEIQINGKVYSIRCKRREG